mgnify:CR=1 FL=1|jgi:hypothetical protein|tara:strand:- start:24 stop:179 length:156 start_codon:yes stop_codon:yes gene_type:complete
MNELEMLDFIKRVLLNKKSSDLERNQAVSLIDELTVPYISSLKKSIAESNF